MKTKLLKIPKGWRVVRNGAAIRKGDRFKKCNGHWSKTSDAGRKVSHGGIPCMPEFPDYAGIYIRKSTP